MNVWTTNGEVLVALSVPDLLALEARALLNL
jgi:hypothetical protein